jgi:predicted metal-dependent HD superfamily phosphohydrolase
MKRYLQISYLFAEWLSAHFRAGVVPSWNEFWRLMKCYSEPHRYYHTVQHIYECLRYLRKHYGDQRMIHLVQFAIFYHDIVYDVTKKDNEEQSAKQWMDYSRNLSSMMLVHRLVVESLIEMTASHKLAPNSSILFKIMNDVDMHVFLCPDGHYLEYARNVWKEYSVFGREGYLKGRLQFLSTIDVDSMFFTSEALEHIHHARANLALEKEILTSCPDQILVSLV